MVLVLKKEVVKTNNVEHEDTGKYRQLLVRTLHQCSVKFPDVAATIIPVVSVFQQISFPGIHIHITCVMHYIYMCPVGLSGTGNWQFPVLHVFNPGTCQLLPVIR